MCVCVGVCITVYVCVFVWVLMCVCVCVFVCAYVCVSYNIYNRFKIIDKGIEYRRYLPTYHRIKQLPIFSCF